MTEISKIYLEKHIPHIFPVPLIDIAGALEYKVYYFKITSENNHISGAVLYNEKQILLNPNESPLRNNFTLAHEIGHIILRHYTGNSRHVDTRNDIRNPPDDQKERDANEFAAELLMPEDKFIEKWNESKSMADTAEFFGTSTASTAVRIQRIGIIYGK
jgi:Zn-dependent peptidase ImmA (M78 family)